jgi:hypothetical protein
MGAKAPHGEPPTAAVLALPADLPRGCEGRWLQGLHLDDDGMPDLVEGLSCGGGEVVVAWSGNPDAVFPHSPEARARRIAGSSTDPFLDPRVLRGEAARHVGTRHAVTPRLPAISLRLDRDARDDAIRLRPGAPGPIAWRTLTGRTFVVDDVGDEADASPGDGACETAASGACTLRAAFMETNATPGVDAIDFDIAGPAPYVIRPVAPFPFVTEAVVIDGTTEPDYAGTPVIEIDGTLRTGVSPGIEFLVGGNVVRGLAVGNFIQPPTTGDAIHFHGGGFNILEACHVGCDATGTVARPNTATGVQCEGRENLIGGSMAAARNVLSGNGVFGVRFGGVPAIGPDNRVMGCFIGTDVTGTRALPNGAGGIVAVTPRCHVGGAAPGEGNVISANGTVGVHLSGASAAGAIVQGNLVGTDVTGEVALGNGTIGILLNCGDDLIGGAAPGEGNVIADNATGIEAAGAAATAAIVQGNLVGVTRSGAPLGNHAYGIAVQSGAGGLVIGGAAAGEGNVIAFSGLAGVSITSGEGTTLRGNAVHDNGDLAIDLDNDGPDVNDALDADAGPNALENFPVIVQASGCSAGLRVSGALDAAPSASFTVEIFGCDACDPSGHGEADRPLGLVDVATDASGHADIDVSLPVVTLPAFVTATATDATGNTSELSACRDVVVDQAGESLNLLWCAGTKTCLQWDPVPGALEYRVVRGEPADLPALLTPVADGCTRWLGAATSTGPVADELPTNGLLWFLVRARNACGEGPAGDATPGPRQQESGGGCP